MRNYMSRKLSRRRKRTTSLAEPEQLETRRLLTSQGVVTGSVFHDTNGDGLRDEGEQGIPGVLVTLTGTTTDAQAVARRFLTAADGSFQFGGLQSGTYELTETQPASIADGSDRTTTPGPVAGDDRYTNVVVAEDATIDGLNFGEGTVDAEFVSPIWLLASSSSEAFHRNMRALAEERAGNSDLAAAIRNGASEVDTDFNLNAAPETQPDDYAVAAGSQLAVSPENGVLANDTDPEDSALTAVLETAPEHGTINLNPSGTFTYTPETGFIGDDTFTYRASDGFKTSAPETVTITVSDPNAFTVSRSAVRGDSVGTVVSLQDLSEPLAYQFLEETDTEALRLVPDDHLTGIPSSPAVLIEYVDFACPACRAYHQTLREFETAFAGDLLIVTRHLPLQSSSLPGALAAEAASRQGLLAPLTDVLFGDDFDRWRNAADPAAEIEALIQESNLAINLNQYRQDVADPDVRARVDRDLQAAQALGFVGTPTFVLNGERIANPPVATFADVITNAVGQAELNPFTIDRTTGELLVLTPARLPAGSSQTTFDVDIRNNNSSETVTVTVNIVE